MMKTKLFRIASVLTAVLLLLTAMCLSASAEKTSDGVRYTDPDTGYRVVIIDELDLLTAAQESQLAEDMEPITQYGNAAFWTTDVRTLNEIDTARLKRKELFGYDSATIFCINMNVRKLTIQSYGAIYQSVNDSLARSITDNVSRYATSKQYYECASNAFSQIHTVIAGEQIPEPMKVMSYVIISVMAGLVIAILAAFATRFKKEKDPIIATIKPFGSGKLVSSNLKYVKIRTDTRVVRTSSGGGSSCSSCSSGSSCSSCSSGGSSCSSCGGGGSSSF